MSPVPIIQPVPNLLIKNPPSAQPAQSAETTPPIRRRQMPLGNTRWNACHGERRAIQKVDEEIELELELLLQLWGIRGEGPIPIQIQGRKTSEKGMHEKGKIGVKSKFAREIIHSDRGSQVIIKVMQKRKATKKKMGRNGMAAGRTEPW
jgi:hypothetical protein